METSHLPFPIVDFHVHFVLPQDMLGEKIRQKYVRQSGEAKLAALEAWSKDYDRQWRRAFGFPEPEDAPPPWAQGASRWREEAKNDNLERIVFVTGGDNATLASIVKSAPETFSGFAHHSPEKAYSPLLLERAVLEGKLSGLKIFAPLLKRPLDSLLFRPLWEKAEELKTPVLIHFGILGGGGGIASGININPLSLEPVAKAFPHIPFVVPHFGCGYVRELLQLCWACANVHVDTSGNNEWLRWYPERLSVEDLFRKFYETVGPRRIIFGSDSSYFPRGFARRYLLDQLRDCYRLGFSQDDMALIFGGNALRLLKGVKN